MKYALIAAAILGLAIFAHSMTQEGDVALVEAVVAGLLVAAAVCALMEGRRVERDHTDDS